MWLGKLMSKLKSRIPKTEQVITKQKIVIGEIALRVAKIASTVFCRRDPNTKEQRRLDTACFSTIQDAIQKYEDDVCYRLANRLLLNSTLTQAMSDCTVSTEKLHQIMLADLESWSN